ncbi:Uncharacterised protein [Vibrio cholerae]|nr:Uncharacterised protein [Vibrio cholerae]CSB39658.1 Uncharacterised protein [Vibrio cholerae]CSB52957.1 Uncharacterised protein [Vibrio cholerae]CSC63868.1 Uncharacterised protein [Vibrio cholerae]
MLTLLTAQWSIQQHPAQTNDTIERSAQLMANGRNKRGFVAAGFLQ